MWETWVRSLGREDRLEKEMAIHSSTIAWKIPWTKDPGRLQSMGSQRVGHIWVTSLHFTSILYWKIPWTEGAWWAAVHCYCSVAKSCLTLCDPMNRSTFLSFTISQSLLKLNSIESMMPSNHLIFCYPLLLSLIFTSIRVFSKESVLRVRWPKY